MGSAQQTYLERVLPWPGEGQNGFIRIEHQAYEENSTQKKFWTGQGFRTPAQAISHIQSLPGRNDVYACQSLQAQQGARKKDNALLLKSLFLDLDYKNYSSKEELSGHLREFLKKLQLFPTVIVDTGGGWHAYWTFKQGVTTEVWYPLANALVESTQQLDLKCDTAVTSDAARVLRIPDTFNYKRVVEGEPVKLKADTGKDYDLEEVEKALLPYKVRKVHHSNGFDASPFIGKKPPPGLDTFDDSLEAGIEPRQSVPRKLDAICAVCPFLAATVKSGGSGNEYPLWYQTILLSSFTVEGRAAAHIVSKGYPRYTPENTDKEYDKAEKSKAEGVGWPGCHVFEGFGAKECKTCPHRGKGKSPISFASFDPKPNTGSTQGGGGPQSPPGVKSTSVLPPGYRRNAHGLIERSITDDKGALTWNRICDVPIGNAWLQRNPWVINFEAQTEPNKTELIALPFELIGAPVELRKDLSRQGITVHDYSVKPVQEFLLSWIHILKQTKDAVVTTAPFGWVDSRNGVEGFAYGGKLYTEKEIKLAQQPDAVTAKAYTPTGDIGPWIDAAKMITNQKRPALDMMLAATFAAPLVMFTNKPGVMLATMGRSGVGKSTVMDVSMAVWGHPTRAKTPFSTTNNSLLNKMGELKSLPIYWDDLLKNDLKRLSRAAFENTSGIEKGRLNANAKQKDQGTWQTLMVTSSNYSMLDVMAEETSTTTAGIYRVFEIEVVSGEHGPGQLAEVDADIITAKLKYNYGRAGEMYAHYLGVNRVALEAEVHETRRALDEQVNAKKEERFWTSLISVIYVGAKIANRLHLTEIDEVALLKFMLDRLEDMRKRLKLQAVDMDENINVSNIISAFLNTYRARNTLITNVIHKAKGKPAKGSIQVKNDASKMDAIYIHIGLDDKIMRVSRTALSEWLKAKNISRHAFSKALQDKFGKKDVIGIIGGGTQYAVPGQTYMLEMNLLDFDNINVDDILTPEGKDTNPGAAQ